MHLHGSGCFFDWGLPLSRPACACAVNRFESALASLLDACMPQSCAASCGGCGVSRRPH